MRMYRGNAEDASSAHVVSVWEDGRLVGTLAHHVKHSPDGFSWGYGGSGPADLARCILIDHLGDKAWCPTCRGSGKECLDCWGERTAFRPGLYQAFKFDVVARFPQAGQWTLDSDQIDQWLACHAP